MMNQKPLRNLFLLSTALLSITSCEIKGDKRKHRGVIEMNKTVPGIYQGTIIEISAHQRLIYLQTTNGQIVEFTFNSDSILTDKGKQVSLKKLKKGNKLEISLKKNNKDNNIEIEKVLLLQ